jgi:hypothetical protein
MSATQIEYLPAGTANNAAEPQTVREVIEWGKNHQVRWFVKDLIQEQGAHILHGLEECFKTMLMLQVHEALTNGGPLLVWNVEGGLRTGIAELEMKQHMSADRFKKFWPQGDVPEIYVLPESERIKVLNGKSGSDRIKIISDWANKNQLDFVSIDSLAKLFPPGIDTSRQDQASDIFSQIQTLPTTLILAHDRKPTHEAKSAQSNGNAEIVGSGRMSQDPDVVLQLTRPDHRLPAVTLDCGKMRGGPKPQPVELFFDAVDFRLHPIHPFLHLLPMTEKQLIDESFKRFGWRERNTRKYIKSLLDLPGVITEQTGANRSKWVLSELSLADLWLIRQNLNEEEAIEEVAAQYAPPGT